VERTKGEDVNKSEATSLVLRLIDASERDDAGDVDSGYGEVFDEVVEALTKGDPVIGDCIGAFGMNYPPKEQFTCREVTVADDYWRYTFAGMAMQGMLADEQTSGTCQECAQSAVEFADALLAELKKGKT
jgi:hypothetical protein